MRQEQLKNQVFQYVGKNTKKADRVYVWGYAATGALGKVALELFAHIYCMNKAACLYVCIYLSSACPDFWDLSL